MFGCLVLISIKWRTTKNSFWCLDFKFIFAVMFIYVYYQNVQAIAVSGRFITACHPTAPRSRSAWGHAGHEGSRLWWASSNTWRLVLAATLLEGSARGGNAGSKVSNCGVLRWGEAGWVGRQDNTAQVSHTVPWAKKRAATTGIAVAA